MYKKIYLIEILRFFASISVVIYHYKIFFFIFNNLNSLKISDKNVESLPFGEYLFFFTDMVIMVYICFGLYQDL